MTKSAEMLKKGKAELINIFYLYNSSSFSICVIICWKLLSFLRTPLLAINFVTTFSIPWVLKQGFYQQPAPPVTWKIWYKLYGPVSSPCYYDAKCKSNFKKENNQYDSNQAKEFQFRRIYVRIFFKVLVKTAEDFFFNLVKSIIFFQNPPTIPCQPFFKPKICNIFLCCYARPCKCYSVRVYWVVTVWWIDSVICLIRERLMSLMWVCVCEWLWSTSSVHHFLNVFWYSFSRKNAFIPKVIFFLFFIVSV